MGLSVIPESIPENNSQLWSNTHLHYRNGDRKISVCHWPASSVYLACGVPSLSQKKMSSWGGVTQSLPLASTCTPHAFATTSTLLWVSTFTKVTRLIGDTNWRRTNHEGGNKEKGEKRDVWHRQEERRELKREGNKEWVERERGRKGQGCSVARTWVSTWLTGQATPLEHCPVRLTNVTAHSWCEDQVAIWSHSAKVE